MQRAELRSLLDDVLVQLALGVAGEAGAPLPVNVLRVEGECARALQPLYDSPSPQALVDAVAAVDAAVALLQPAEAHAGAAQLLSQLARARTALATLPPDSLEARADAPLPERPALRARAAGPGAPRLLHHVRARILAALPLPEPEEDFEPEATLPGAESLADREHFGVQRTETEVLADRLRSCVEDLSILHLMRVPLPGQGWHHRGRTEARLLCRLDAMVAVGEPLWPRIPKQLESPVPDPGTWWANLFFFGSLSGDDALAQVMRLLRVAPGLTGDAPGTELQQAVADALALAPHPALAEALRPWLRASFASQRWVATGALGRKGALGLEELRRLSEDDSPAVVERAAQMLPRLPVAPDVALLRTFLERPGAGDEEATVRAALEGALFWRLRVARVHARQLCEEGRPDFADAATLLALGAEAADGELLRACAAQGSRSALQALGWLGDPAGVPLLLRALENKATAPDAASALQRITGAALLEGMPLPRFPDAPPFSAEHRPPDPPDVLSQVPGEWRAYWEAFGGAARAGTCHRLGQPWTAQVVLASLAAPASGMAERRLGHLELCVRTGRSLPLEVLAFVAEQETQLATWRAALSERGAPRSTTSAAWASHWAAGGPAHRGR